MDQALGVRVVQGAGNLSYIPHDKRKRHPRSLRMALTQGSVRGILHHQVRNILLYIEIHNTYDVRMRQVGDSARLGEKVLQISAGEICVQQLYRDPRIQIDMFSLVYSREATGAYSADEAVLAKALSNVMIHHSSLSFD